MVGFTIFTHNDGKLLQIHTSLEYDFCELRAYGGVKGLEANLRALLLRHTEDKWPDYTCHALCLVTEGHFRTQRFNLKLPEQA